MNRKQPLVTGAIMLTAAGFISRIMGFFYRIFLSHTIGAEGMGIYQLLFPLQALCMAITLGGMQTAISRLCATAFSLHHHTKGKDICLAGILSTIVLSLPVAYFLYTYAQVLGQFLYEDPRIASLIRLMAWSIPFANIHSCIMSYFLADKKASVPAALQLVEQTVRLMATSLLYEIFLQKQIPVTPQIAMGGTLISEIVTSAVSFICLSWSMQKNSVAWIPVLNIRRHCSRIAREAFPLSCNRIMIHLLNSLEAILIPRQLLLYGYTSSESLSVYGVFTGMSLPLLLFPSAITNSVSVLLTPTIAGARAVGNHQEIQNTFQKTVTFSLLLGGFSSLGFFILGKPVCSFLFQNTMAGEFIRSLSFICPFLYLSTTLSSVLMGLGKNGACLFSNCICILIRMVFLLLTVPGYGMQGYLWGLLLGELCHTGLTLFFCRQAIRNVL